ncbi:MAG TPA: hypothetical protein VGI40_19945 [Pirellulaceae bacterium]|jgi:hypothetical protein
MFRFIVAAAIAITGILATTPANAFHHRWGGCGYGGCGYGYGGCGYGGCGYGGYGYGGYGYGGYGYRGYGYPGYGYGGFGMAPAGGGYGSPLMGYRGYGPVATPMYSQPNVVPVSPYGYAMNQPSGAVRPASNNAPVVAQGKPVVAKGMTVATQGTLSNMARPKVATPAAIHVAAPARAAVNPSAQLTSNAQR